MLASRAWPSPKCRPQRTYRAWLAHGLPPETIQRAGSARKSFGTALRAAAGDAREPIEEEAHADPIDPSAAKRAGAIWCWTSEASGAMCQTVRGPSPARPSMALATAGPLGQSSVPRPVW